jgi:hypothetical protein
MQGEWSIHTETTLRIRRRTATDAALLAWVGCALAPRAALGTSVSGSLQRLCVRAVIQSRWREASDMSTERLSVAALYT